METESTKRNIFERLSSKVSKVTGSTAAFIVAVVGIIIWLLTGPAFNYSNTWQLVINTGTTIITFLMVFLIQRSQNKESLAMQIKLNELIACNRLASNRLIDIEDLSEAELNTLERFYIELVKMSKRDKDMRQTHSIGEANQVHTMKVKYRHEISKK